MAVVISNDKTQGHIINKYNFKVMNLGSQDEEEFEAMPLTSMQSSAPVQESAQVQSEPNEITSTSRDQLVDSLLKKADDMSSNFIKMQMKIEALEEEHKRALEKMKEESFNLGVEEGRKFATEELNQSVGVSLEQYSQSVMRLEDSSKEFVQALSTIENDLVSAAIDISKEVIAIELSTNSSEVAYTLAQGLIKELQDAAKVTIKVNPANHGELSSRLGSLSQVEVLSDSAISLGGVIVMSSAGNIDAEINKRFERVKKSALAQ